ncbi:right-handed parallel beta-helix repeat-containing protein [Fulvivirga sedimenti]|uniref:Right-handed parallel beta-helix repeat-containing protein n=1 Tax=Fulvivirga sedimenti TaxID=2879465 RepID=A0A9X1KV52_9BACT|nr:right-handed parallel beta-helix repeat-containing protein [Fulvivirga sedimenti]MCA6073415.1 right-handed parallel beta-helix repeat-containing protein [Fulvivirga sedimenti]
MRSILIYILLLSSFALHAQDRKTIVYDGSDLKTFFNELKDNSIVIFKNEEIIYEETLIVEGKTNIEFQFNGFTIKSVTNGENATPSDPVYKNRWPRNRAHFVIKNSDSIIVRDLRIVGPNINGGVKEEAYVKELEAQHALELRNTSYIQITDCAFSQIYGDGIYITGTSENIDITKSIIEKNGRQGIAITNGSNISIRENQISMIRRSHIDLEPNNDGEIVSNVLIENNEFGRQRLNWVAAASSKGVVRNVTVKNNMVNSAGNIWIGNKSNKHMQGPYIFDTNTSTKIYGTNNGGIWRLIRVDGFKAVANNIMAQANRRMFLIYATDSENIELGENEVPNGRNQYKTYFGKGANK